MSNIPSPGKYRARCTARPFYPEPGESGSVMIHIPCELVNSDPAHSGVAKTVFVKRDGSLMKKSIQAINLIFGGEMTDIFFVDNISDEELVGKEFEIVGSHSQFTPEGAEESITTFDMSWPAPIGGMGATPITVETRKELLTKFGSKFKALFGPAGKAAAVAAKPAQTASKPAPAGKTLPAAKPASSGPPARKSTGAMKRTSSQDEVWEAYAAATADMDEDKRAEAFYDACNSVVENAQEDLTVLTPTQWGEVADKLEV